MEEILFEIDVSTVDDIYGLTLFVDDGSDSEVVPCFRLMFKGGDGIDDESVAKAFSSCHQETMESCGISGELTTEEFGNLLIESIAAAGALMIKYGFTVVPASEVSDEISYALWGDQIPESELLDTESEPDLQFDVKLTSKPN